MKLEDLDTQLRNKLQLIESDIHPNEMDGIMTGLGMPQQGKKKSYLWIIGLVLLLSASATALYWSNNKITPSKISINQTTPENNPNKINLNQSDKLSNPATKTGTTEIKPTGQKVIQRNPTSQIYIKQNPTQATKHIPSKTKKLKNNIPIEHKKTVKHIRRQIKPNLIEPFTHTRGIKSTMVPSCSCPLEEIDQLLTTFPKDQPTVPKDKKYELKKRLNPEVSIWASTQVTKERQSLIFANEDRVHKNYINNYEQGLRNNWTTNAGVNLRFKLLPFLKTGTGIGFIQSGQAYNYDFKINNIPVEDAATGKIFGYITKPDTSSQHIQERGVHNATYLSIPLSLSFNLFQNNKWSLGAEANYTHQWLLNEKGNSLEYNTLQLKNKRTFTSSIGNYQIGLPITIHPLNRISFTLNPYYGKALQSVKNNALINTKRNYAGLQFSINYRLLNL